MTNQSREAFEKWAMKRYYNVYRRGEGYVEQATQHDWITWQAALSEGRRRGLEEACQRLESSASLCESHSEARALLLNEFEAIRALIVGGGEGA